MNGAHSSERPPWSQGRGTQNAPGAQTRVKERHKAMDTAHTKHKARRKERTSAKEPWTWHT